MRIDWFLIGLVAVVGLAWLWPEPGATGGFLHIDWVSTYGICIVFFLYGLTLAPEKMRAGIVHWRLHLVVQFGTFVLFPLLVLALGAPLRDDFPAELLTGFFFLAALPSTVSSAVAMTSLAGGNVPAAIFNATLSSLLGVFLTPLLMAWYAATAGASMPVGPVILKVLLLILLPIALGQAARPLLGAWAARHPAIVKVFDRGIILAIVYGSFCDSLQAGIWDGHDATLLLEMAGGVVVLFGVVYAVLAGVCRGLGFGRADTIAAVFCGSKKSLATGVPLATLMFGGMSHLGFVLAPIMLYHFFQLVAVGFIAGRYARAGTGADAGATPGPVERGRA